MTFDLLSERMQAKIDVGHTDDCWLWAERLTTGGYGQVWLREEKRRRHAHRVVYEALVGPIPKGLDLDHLCRIRACVNPDHLEPVTRKENVRRSPIHSGSKTHCPRGHPYSGTNLYVSPRGKRLCRQCQQDRDWKRKR